MSAVDQGDEYHALFGDLVAMEAYRRSLLEQPAATTLLRDAPRRLCVCAVGTVERERMRNRTRLMRAPSSSLLLWPFRSMPRQCRPIALSHGHAGLPGMVRKQRRRNAVLLERQWRQSPKSELRLLPRGTRATTGNCGVKSGRWRRRRPDTAGSASRLSRPSSPAAARRFGVDGRHRDQCRIGDTR